MKKERWATKTGLILALAGNAVGLGNFLRFPVQVARNGGGIFMIPYFIALFLVGIPLKWVELSIGRLGGKHGYHNCVGMFGLIGGNPRFKYIGVLGLFIPFIICVYYTYIVSWTLGYSVFSFLGSYFGLESRECMGAFLKGYQGIESNQYFSSLASSYTFFLVCLGLVMYVLYKGVSRGIEKLAKVAVPLLILFGVILMIRVFLLGTPDPSYPERNISNGLGFIWNPNFSQLSSASIWLAAAGQVFFTLSVGWGTMHNYASYIREKDDIALTGLASSSINEFTEVIIGGAIAIPAAVAFFGLIETQSIAKGGAFDLGFQSLPIVFQKIPLGEIFGGMWFLLLFFAGITSSVAMGQPVMSFLEGEMGFSRKKATVILGIALLLVTQPVIFFLGNGFLDELDFWVGSFTLVVFAFLETIIFGWIFGMNRGWKEIIKNAEIKVPRIFYYILKYITPLFLFAILAHWAITEVPSKLSMVGIDEGNIPYIMAARIMMAGIFLLFVFLVWRGDRGKRGGRA